LRALLADEYPTYSVQVVSARFREGPSATDQTGSKPQAAARSLRTATGPATQKVPRTTDDCPRVFVCGVVTLAFSHRRRVRTAGLGSYPSPAAMQGFRLPPHQETEKGRKL